MVDPALCAAFGQPSRKKTLATTATTLFLIRLTPLKKFVGARVEHRLPFLENAMEDCYLHVSGSLRLTTPRRFTSTKGEVDSW